ncbi:hypothetical protein ACRCQW_26465, partial [Pseudomonas aeruginosa]
TPTPRNPPSSRVSWARICVYYTPPAPTIQQKPADPEQKAIDDKVKQQVAKEEAERKQFCEETRNNLAQLKNNPRVRVDEGKGELRRLGEEERQERIAKAEKAIQENCR